MSHHVARTQRRFAVVLIVITVVVVAIGTPLLVLPDFRLSVGHRLGIVPGGNAELLFGPEERVELVALIEEIPVRLTLPSRRFTAIYIVERRDASVQLHDLARDTVIPLPLTDYDRVAAADDRSAVLFVNEPDAPGEVLQAVLVNVSTGDVTELPPGEIDPGLPGDWDAHVPFPLIQCRGTSPSGQWVACVTVGGRQRLFGSWDLIVHRAGDTDERYDLYRGAGLLPIAGWAADESGLYFQNELGIWWVPMPADARD